MAATLNLDGVRALVAGAQADVVRAMSLALLEAGAAAVCTWGAPLTGQPHGLVTIEGDADDRAGCGQIVQRAIAAVGGLDVFVNCVGGDSAAVITDDAADIYEQVVHRPLRRLYFLNQAVHDVMKVDGGRIINVACEMCRTPGVAPATAAVRSGLAQLTKTMAVEWAKEKIRVNCVLPPSGATSAEDVAAFVIALASRASAHVSGQTIHVDGGATAGGSWDQP